MRRSRPPANLAVIAACMLLAAGGGFALPASAGSASAAFTVTASFKQTGTCLLNPGTGALQCTTVPSPPATPYWSWQPNLAGYLGYEGYWVVGGNGVLGDSYSGLLGAYSSVRTVSFGGREYLEMTVSW
jgi:hypothetical protein